MDRQNSEFGDKQSDREFVLMRSPVAVQGQ